MKSIEKVLQEYVVPIAPHVFDVFNDEMVLIYGKSGQKPRKREPEAERKLNQPFRMEYLSFVICKEGTITYSVDMQSYTLRAGDGLIILPNSIGQLEVSSEDLELYFLGVRRSNYPTELGLNETISLSADIFAQPLIHLSDSEIQTVYSMFRLMKQTNEMPAVLHHLLASFYTFIGSIVSRTRADSTMLTRPQSIAKEFLKLLGKNFRQEHKISFYADKLCVTDKHLSESVKQATGVTAKQWIQKRLILEAKTMLISDDLTVKQISDTLGFPNESFFGTFFLKETGMTPAKFAKEYFAGERQ